MKKIERHLSTRWLAVMACGALVGAGQMAHAEEGKTATAATAKKKSTKTKTPRVRGTANARILHAIAGGPAVDVYVDGKKVLTGASYKSLSDYVPLSSGKHTIKISEGGKTDALLSGAVNLSKDKFFTLAAYGTPQKPLLLRVNETTGKMFEGKSRVFVTHLAQAPAADITTPSTRNKKSGYATFVKKLEPGKTRAKTTSSGATAFQVRSSGAVLKEEKAIIEAGKRYSIFVVGPLDALDVLVKQAAPTYLETVVVPKTSKAAATPKASAIPSPTP